MITINSANFKSAIELISYHFEVTSKRVHTQRWQGADISKKPEMATHELLNVAISVPLHDDAPLATYQEDIGPNLPWADDHFLERVSGEPLNPGKQWRNWPWALSADNFRTGDGRSPCSQVPNEDRIFNHTYMERYWPVFANREAVNPNYGIRHMYGDLQDLVILLAKEPDTRQAWIPIFFPEDTGRGDGGRKPCTLGYQFIMRNNQLHVYYPLRSCDFIRHFRDDVYLTVRLLLWVLDKCRDYEPHAWKKVVPGTYTMHCTSLHMFENDYRTFLERRRTS